MHREEINRLVGKVERAGYTLTPLDLHYKNGPHQARDRPRQGQEAARQARRRSRTANGREQGGLRNRTGAPRRQNTSHELRSTRQSSCARRRRRRSGDRGDLRAVTCCTARRRSSSMPPDVAEMAARMRAIAGRGGYPCVVAATAMRALIGYAYAGPYRMRGPRTGTRPRIRSTSRPGCRRPGHRPARCSTSLIDACETRGDRQMIAVIGDSRQRRVGGAVHAAAGFTDVGVLRGRRAASSTAGSTSC